MLEVRPAAVAGTFYPAEASVLGTFVDELMAAADGGSTEPMPKAAIVPHAGYIYSGPIAARVYERLRRGAAAITRVVLVGPSHRVRVRGLAAPSARALETPLGPVAVDRDALALVPRVTTSDLAHAREHSLEVQLPFLRRALPAAKVVPLVFGDATAADVAEVLHALWGGPETVILVSSDLSHYLPYDTARAVDEETARAIVAMNAAVLEPERACGSTAVAGLLLEARRRGLRSELLDLRSSGDTAGDRRRVVGYGAFAFFERDTSSKDQGVVS